MAVYKDKWNGYKGDTWRVAVYYKDWKGIRRKHEKRGFATKKEALAYEREYIAKTSKDTNMGFDTFVDIYMSDIKPQIKLSTYVTKENIINAHICSYFENKSLSEITANDILQWQNALLSLRDDDGKGYSQTYLRTIQNQLNAIFNHAVKYYDLPKNPCIANKKMGKSKSKEMLFWTMDEYLKFSEVMKEKPISYYAFQILYWTGIRCGELLALTRADFDFENRILSINKTYQVIKGEETVEFFRLQKVICIMRWIEGARSRELRGFDSMILDIQAVHCLSIWVIHLYRLLSVWGMKVSRLRNAIHICIRPFRKIWQRN